MKNFGSRLSGLVGLLRTLTSSPGEDRLHVNSLMALKGKDQNEMVDKAAGDTATSIWNRRYDDGDAACAREPDGTDVIDYTQHDFLNRHLVSKPLTGIPTRESFDFLMGSLFGLVQAKRVLAIGSGLGFAEQALITSGVVDNIDAYELSETAVASARQRLVEAGLDQRLVMHAGDVLKAGLEEGTYDAVFVSAAIHHFFNIEEMMDFIHMVLKPGGVLIYNEYVGPDHHIYHDKVMSYADKINACLDSKFRFDALRNEIRQAVPRATLDWMLEMDPSEGVHSSMILPLTYQKFEVIQRFDFGGTLMRPFWVGILPNFDFSDYKDQTIARLIGLIEELLLDSGLIPTYHTIIAARKTSDGATKPLIDNEILSYKNHGIEVDKLSPTIFHAENVISCADFTDENWLHGVSRGGPLRLLVVESPGTLCALAKNDLIVLGPKKTAKINSIEVIRGKVILNCSAETFKRHEVAAPNMFWVTK